MTLEEKRQLKFDVLNLVLRQVEIFNEREAESGTTIIEVQTGEIITVANELYEWISE